jgi:16S rRNA (guanine1207-N2)-methyltransferase
MSSDHYFSQEPKSNYQPKQIELNIAGEVFKVSTASGTFSPLRLDVGTEVLLDHLDLAPKEGNILDLGCGWGPIALNLAKHSPKAKVWAVDVNNRSLELTAENAKTLGLSNIHTETPDSVPKDIEFSGIWSNPPIRIGKKQLHELLLTWLPRLENNASAYLVVQKNLGSDSLQKWLIETLVEGYEVSRLTSVKTYRIIKVLKTS